MFCDDEDAYVHHEGWMIWTAPQVKTVCFSRATIHPSQLDNMLITIKMLSGRSIPTHDQHKALDIIGRGQYSSPDQAF